MIHGSVIPEHYEHGAEKVARYSSAGEQVAREFNPRGLAASKRKQRTRKAVNAVEAATFGRIDKKARNKAQKLAKREAKRRGLAL
jgi:hypothetical protein